MGQMIEFARADGKKVRGYEAVPAHAASAPGVVVLHEYWGLEAPRSNIRDVAERFAKAGYHALAPDLYHGKTATTADEASRIMGALDWGGAVEDIRGALTHLKNGGQKAAVLGFCMGGALAILTAANAPAGKASSSSSADAPDAVVSFYGVPPATAADPARIRVPLLGHFASHDEWISANVVTALEAALKSARVEYQIHRYEGHHAFFNDLRPDVYDAHAAATAWQRTLAFLQHHLA